MSQEARQAACEYRFSPEFRARVRQESLVSKEQRYPMDWLYDYVEGDGDQFDYGIDYTGCGICRFYNQQGAGEIVQYLCALDFIFYGAIGAGLERTMTIAQGDHVCDFRFKKGRTTKCGRPQ
jgi:hypothetical protein